MENHYCIFFSHSRDRSERKRDKRDRSRSREKRRDKDKKERKPEFDIKIKEEPIDGKNIEKILNRNDNIDLTYLTLCIKSIRYNC